MKSTTGHWLFALTALLAPLSAPSAQVTITASADTSLWQRETWKNLGASDMLPAGSTSSDGDTTKCRMLLAFNLVGSLPPDAVIESATLSLTIVRAPSDAPTKPINGSTFTLLRAFQPWGEGTKTYTNFLNPMQTIESATAGEATWIYRFFGDETKRWILPGGELNDGDFSEPAGAGGSVFVGSGPGGEYSIALNAAGLGDLNSWLADPSQNFGWMVKSDLEHVTGTARLFGSRENADPNVRPRLTIVYTSAQPNPPQIQSITRNGSSVTIRFTAQANVVYRPQRRPTVNSGQWFDLPDLGPLVSDGQLEFSENLTGVDERYYRVIIP